MSIRIKLCKRFCSNMYMGLSSGHRLMLPMFSVWHGGVLTVVCWGAELRIKSTLQYSLLFVSALNGNFACERWDLQALRSGSAQFILSCLNSYSSLVNVVLRQGVEIAHHSSCVVRNVLFCCNYFSLRLPDFQVPLVNFSLNYNCS